MKALLSIPSPLFYFARTLFTPFILAVVLVNTACAQSVAFTFDDGPKLIQTPMLTPAARNQALLDALSKHHVKAALFVSTINGLDQPEGLELGRAWGKAGHLIGNHTVTHLDLNKSSVTLAQYQQEIQDIWFIYRAYA